MEMYRMQMVDELSKESDTHYKQQNVSGTTIGIDPGREYH